MCHTNDECTSALFHCGVNAELETWDERFAAIESKALHRIELLGHEGAPLVRPIQASVHVNFLSFSLLSELNRFKLLTDPIANFTVLNMHELNTNLAAVSLSIGINNISQLPLWLSLDNSALHGHMNIEFTVHIGLSESVSSRAQ